ncbi:hypothetical protein AAIR98_000117 [Elusimicrobium simillimum]|uniref:hypothetical protein n=1 Tax=Elusimicrobium simillimum TaxID=3143438 RepID=UPI003C701A8A
MKKITDILLAIKTYAHQIHLNFKDYGDHLLADKMREDIDADIDRLKELVMATMPEISHAVNTLSGAFALLEPIPLTTNINEMFDYLYSLNKKLIAL